MVEVQGMGGMGIPKKNLRTFGSLWDFKADDIISDSRGPYGPWYEKKVKVLGFLEFSTSRGIESRLYGTVVGEYNPLFTLDPLGLILIERISFTFKVGDKFKVLRSDVILSLKKGMIGEIIVLDPSAKAIPYLMRFKEYKKGDVSQKIWDYPWFPDKEKKEREDCLWMDNGGIICGDFLELLKK